MHTRRSKLTEDAAESDGTEGGATPVTSTEEVVSDSISTEEGVSSNISQTVEGALGSVKMEDAPSLTTSTVEGDASKTEHTLDESVAKSVVCSSEKSTAAEEITADVLTMETDSSSTTVPNALTESTKNSVQKEGSHTTESDTTNMEELPEKSIDNGKVNGACVTTKSEVVPEALDKKTDKRKPEENKPMCKYINEYAAEFKIMGRKFCEERNIPFPNRVTLKKIIFDLYKNEKLDKKNLEVKLEEAAQGKLNASARPMATETSEKVIGGEVSDTKEEGEQSISSGNDVDPESPDKSISENEAVQREVEAKFEEYRNIGEKYCACIQLKMPDGQRFREIMSELASKQQLNVTELKNALDIHGWLAREQSIWFRGSKLKPRFDVKGEIVLTVVKKPVNMTRPMATETSEKVIGGEVSDTKEEGEQSISSGNDVDTESPDKSISENEAVQREVEAKFEEYRDIGEKYCACKQLKMPDGQRYREIMSELASKQQLNVTELKNALDIHGWLAREQSIWFRGSKIQPRLNAKGEIILSVVKKPVNMTRPMATETSKKEGEQSISSGNVVDGNNQGERLLAVGPNKKLSKMTENSRDRYDRGPWNASSSGATCNAASSSYTNTSSRRLDEEPIQQLLHTQQWIAGKARMLGGLDSRESVVSRSLPYCNESLWGRSKMRWDENQEQQGKGMNLHAQCDYSQSQPWGQGAMNVPNLFPSAPIFQPAQSYFPEPNFSGQNHMIANSISQTNISGAFGGQSFSAAQPAWPNEPPMENRGHYSAGMPKDDYSRNLGWAENYRTQGTGFGSHSLGRDRVSPPPQNTTNWDDLGRRNNEVKCVGELLEFTCPPPPIISTLVGKPAVRNSQEQSCRAKDGDDWRWVRGAPPQKKSRFDEDRQPQPSQPVDLQHVVNDLQSRFAEDNRMSSEPFKPNTSSRRSWGQASPPGIGDQSKPLMIKESPPLVAHGKSCKVAIVHEDYPRRDVTDQEATLIRTALLECIEVQTDASPRFGNTYQERGAVIFECEDQLTVTWLWVNASTIIPWRSAKLRPTSWEKPPNEISIYVPKLLQCPTAQALCSRLMRQNPDLSTESWKFKSTDSSSFDGRNFVFYIDDESMETLKSLDFRPYLGFSRVTVHVKQK